MPNRNSTPTTNSLQRKHEAKATAEIRLKTIAYAWASPYTLCGLALGVLLRGNFRIHTGVVEIDGPRVTWFLTRCLPIAALAWTVGHAVLAHSPAAHDLTRAHERVHVRQFTVLGLSWPRLPARVTVRLDPWRRRLPR